MLVGVVINIQLKFWLKIMHYINFDGKLCSVFNISGNSFSSLLCLISDNSTILLLSGVLV